MQKQIIGPRDNIMTIEQIDAAKYFGVRIGGWAGFICRERHYEGKFIVRALEEMTEGNGWSAYAGETLPECVTLTLAGNNKVYQFDTAAELFNWLIENNDKP